MSSSVCMLKLAQILEVFFVKKQVWVIGLVFLIMALGVTAAFGETIISVSSPDEMVAAGNTINRNGGKYTINLDADIESYLSINNSNAEVTLVGNEHTLSTKTQAIEVWNGVLYLGDGESKLTIAYTGTKPDNDKPGLVSVRGASSICHMQDKVTIKDSKKDNYLGAGVTVEGGTFHMHGGAIQNCSIVSGSVCYGGGVAVYSGGKFIMDDGIIENCSAATPYDPAKDDDLPDRKHIIVNAGGGVFVSGGGNFTMNGGTIRKCKADYGAGVALVLSNKEKEYTSYGYLNSIVTINGGEIIGNNASYMGGGIFASGYLYAYANAIATYGPGIGINNSTGLYVKEGGMISDNKANEGGGIFLLLLKDEGKQHTQIHNATISGNKAAQGAGIKIFSYWTALELKDCTITGNKATQDENGNGGVGGGIMVYDNTSTRGTKMLGNNILCNNKADTMGADAYVYNSVTINLTSASDMDQTYDNTGFLINGWYDDTNPRWSETKAFGTGNTYLGDKYKTPNSVKQDKGIIAAFAGYDKIQVTKNWRDNNNALGKRPNSVTFTLTDAENNPINLSKYDEATKKWIESSEPAKITLTKGNEDSTDPNKWKGTIEPLLLNDYSDSTKYRLSESETGNLYKLNSSYLKKSSSKPGTYLASFTNSIVYTPVSFTVTFDLGDGTVISQQIVTEGNVASKPEDPVRTGYKFVQWMNGQEPYDFSTPVTGDLTLTAQWKEAGEYFVAEGQDSIWQKEDSQLLLFHIRNTVNDEKTYGKFTYIEVDGQKVEADTREAQMGGIIIELKPGFLETLSLGRHILRVYFSDGAVDVIFHVVQTEAINETLPDTGDNSNLLYWIGLAFIGAVGIIVLLKRRKRNS